MKEERKVVSQKDAYSFSIKAIKVTMQENVIKFVDDFQSDLFSDLYTAVYKLEDNVLVCENKNKDLIKMTINDGDIELYSLKNSGKELTHIRSFTTAENLTVVNVFELTNRVCKKNRIKRSSNLQVVYSKNKKVLIKYNKVISKYCPNRKLYSKNAVKTSEYETTIRYSSTGIIEQVEKVLNHGNVYESYNEINESNGNKIYRYKK